MPDDLLTTVKAWLRKLDTRLIVTKQPETDTLAVILEDLPCTVVGWLRALLARCEAAEGCDGNCSCVVMSRHEWQRAYSEERPKREAAEAERDALRTMNDPEGGEKRALIARLVKAESELSAARAEVARLREIVAHYGWCQECGDGPDCDDMVRMKAALDTPARDGGET